MQSAQSRPAGVRLSVPSGLTDKPLVYFYPHEIQELIQGLSLSPVQQDSPPIDFASGVLLTRYLMKKGFFELTSATPYSGFDCFIQPRQLRNEQDYLDLATFVTGRPQKLRTAITFTGGSSPSTAVHIYPPHQELPRLFGSLSSFFNEDWSAIDPVHAVAIVFYYALSIHPFADGNGRWARQLAVAAAHKAGDPWLAVALLVFFSRSEKHIISVWKKAETGGLGQYLEECVRANHKISEGVTKFASYFLVRSVIEILTERCGRKHAEKLFCGLVAKGSLSERRVAAALQCSQKKAAGIISSLQESACVSRMEYGKDEFNFQGVIVGFCSEIDKIPLID